MRTVQVSKLQLHTHMNTSVPSQTLSWPDPKLGWTGSWHRRAFILV